VRVCPSCGEENADRAKFCQNCATPLMEVGAAEEVRRVVTIVFADVTGSTFLGDQLDPEWPPYLLPDVREKSCRDSVLHGR